MFISDLEEAVELQQAMDVAKRWCSQQGDGFQVVKSLGPGGTAFVFEIETPSGAKALKVNKAKFSDSEIEEKRIDQQLALKGHDCPHLIQVFDGGRFEDRLVLLMERAAGRELAKVLPEVPRSKIRQIVGQVVDAISYLRKRDLCHRDIKSENIFVSDDFEHVTLLDISVVRGVIDPLGSGTDEDGKLPVVATARYSPPEYLFRLLPPGPELWHALDIYQLGALLHDLIMRQPIFEAEHALSKSNRYRFAWVVATVDVQVDAADVDQDLIVLARRALDKDWKRRSRLKLENFLPDEANRQQNALATIGLSRQSDMDAPQGETAEDIQLVANAARDLEEILRIGLFEKRVTTIHRSVPLGDNATKLVTLQWEAGAGNALPAGKVQLDVILRLVVVADRKKLAIKVTLSTEFGGKARQASLDLPESAIGPMVIAEVGQQVIASLGDLAMQVATNEAPGGDENVAVVGK